MKTIKANKFSAAKKELSELDKELSSKLKENINEREKFYFHVLLITIFPKPGSPKNDVRYNVHQYHKKSFPKIEKNFVAQGFNKLIVLHDPSLVEEEEQIIVPNHVKTKSEAEIREQLQKEFDEKLKAKTQEALDEYKMNVRIEKEESKKETERTGIDLEKATSLEMQTYADQNKIDITNLRNKDEYKIAITEWLKNWNEGVNK